MIRDDYKHKGLRRKLVKTISKKGITDQAVLDAIGTVPRHLFLDEAFLKFAYDDCAFQIDAGQTISQPYTVAVQTSLLEVKKGNKVLEIGTGSGYQAAVLLELGAKVYTVERQRSLYVKSKNLLNQIGYFPKNFFGNGFDGLPPYAPFDKIIVTAAAPSVPPPLLSQLNNGGILVIPVNKDDAQTMLKIKNTGDGKFITEEHGTFKFVPLLYGKEI